MSRHKRAPFGEKSSRPGVYFSRAIYGISELAIMNLASIVSTELEDLGFKLIDPYIEGSQSETVGDYCQVVRSDLDLLRQSDAVLVDMTIAGRNYIGCTCEIVYAFLAKIPTVAYVGSTENGDRGWLKYHVSEIFVHRRDALDSLCQIFSSRGSA